MGKYDDEGGRHDGADVVMQQILKFNIELFDVRMRSSISIINDTNLVRGVQINKSTTLDNTATITFVKSKTYEMLPMESILKLYNYVKIELLLKNYGPDSESKFYFSGFIQTINKAAQFGQSPSATVTITVGDYASLLKTTFYTKNLTFLDILNQAVPEFRLINLSEYLGDSSQKLLDGFYSPTQLGFIFFAFLYFKFMYKIVYDEDGNTKKTAAPDSKEIFKKFKIYMPFGFDVGDVFSATTEGGFRETMLKGQEQSLAIYKQLQGVALDLFKYIYPEPIFEFSTHETVDSVILQIRFTPFMKFDRALIPPKDVSFGPGDFGGEYQEKKISTQDYAFDPKSYNTIERYEFGFDRVKAIRAGQGRAPAALLREHLNETNKKRPRGLITTLQDAIGDSKNLDVEDMIASDDESDKMTELFFNVTPIDTSFLESLSMTRSASSVVNVIWTVPTTDTAVLKMSGRELVYAYLEQRLNEVGGADKFGNYIYQQFKPGFDANPVFLMDYRKVFGNDFVSGDMNYFGFREFEIKWNYLSTNYSTVNHILTFIDKKVLADAKAASKDKLVTRMLDEAIKNNDDPVSWTSTVKPIKKPKPFDAAVLGAMPLSEPFGGTFKPPTKSVRQTSRFGNLPKPSKNKNPQLEEAKRALLKDALNTYKISDIKELNNATTLIALIKKAKDNDAKLMGGFVSQLNSVIAEAYRENEHLYDCNFVKPIDLSVLPGMIVESSSKTEKASSPRFKGYVTAISHVIDFNAATMKTTLNVSRTASDDSGVVARPGA